MNWGVVVLAVLIIVGAVLLYRRNKIKTDAEDLLKESMPLWATFAPFKDGRDSAGVLYYCQWATLGKSAVESLAERNVYINHEASYNADVQSWKKVIEASLEHRVEDLEKKSRLVSSLYKLDQDAKAGNPPEWNAYYALGHIVLFPGNGAGKKLNDYLSSILSINNEVDEALSNYLEDFVVYTGSEVDATMATGLLCLAGVSYAVEHPDDAIGQTILNLRDKAFEEFDRIKKE